MATTRETPSIVEPASFVKILAEGIVAHKRGFSMCVDGNDPFNRCLRIVGA